MCLEPSDEEKGWGGRPERLSRHKLILKVCWERLQKRFSEILVEAGETLCLNSPSSPLLRSRPLPVAVVVRFLVAVAAATLQPCGRLCWLCSFQELGWNWAFFNLTIPDDTLLCPSSLGNTSLYGHWLLQYYGIYCLFFNTWITNLINVITPSKSNPKKIKLTRAW